MQISRITHRIKSNFRSWIWAHAEGTRFSIALESLNHLRRNTDYLMSILHAQRVPRTALESCARKVFSQSDEDGITIEILKRIGISNKTCLEIGCGNGLENNTLILLASGWKAIWIDGLELAFNPAINPERLTHSRSFITRDNVCELVKSLSKNQISEIEFISIDIDGNDGYLSEKLLVEGFRPSVFVVEINEVFPPPIVFRQDYLESHVWDHSRNYGWSLQAFIDLFDLYGYRLVACNPQTGVNAFFVRQDYVGKFDDIPSEPAELYVGRSIHPFKYRDQKLSFDAATIAHLITSLK